MTSRVLNAVRYLTLGLARLKSDTPDGTWKDKRKRPHKMAKDTFLQLMKSSPLTSNFSRGNPSRNHVGERMDPGRFPSSANVAPEIDGTASKQFGSGRACQDGMVYSAFDSAKLVDLVDDDSDRNILTGGVRNERSPRVFTPTLTPSRSIQRAKFDSIKRFSATSGVRTRSPIPVIVDKHMDSSDSDDVDDLSADEDTADTLRSNGPKTKRLVRSLDEAFAKVKSAYNFDARSPVRFTSVNANRQVSSPLNHDARSPVRFTSVNANRQVSSPLKYDARSPMRFTSVNANWQGSSPLNHDAKSPARFPSQNRMDALSVVLSDDDSELSDEQQTDSDGETRKSCDDLSSHEDSSSSGTDGAIANGTMIESSTQNKVCEDSVNTSNTLERNLNQSVTLEVQSAKSVEINALSQEIGAGQDSSNPTSIKGSSSSQDVDRSESLGEEEGSSPNTETVQVTPEIENICENCSKILSSSVVKNKQWRSSRQDYSQEKENLFRLRMEANKARGRLGPEFSTGTTKCTGISLQDQTMHLSQILQAAIDRRESKSALILGSHGSGKKFLVNKVVSTMQLNETGAPQFSLIRLDGIHHRDANAAMRAVAAQLFSADSEALQDGLNSYDFVGGNLSKQLRFLMSEISRTASSDVQGAWPIVFVLERFECFLDARKQTLLYNILDLTQQKDACIVLLGLSWQYNVMSLLEKRVASRFDNRLILVPPKNLEDVQNILLERFKNSENDVVEGTFRWNERIEESIRSDENKAALDYMIKRGFSLANIFSVFDIVLGKLSRANRYVKGQSLIEAECLYAALKSIAPDFENTTLTSLSVPEFILLIAMMRLIQKTPGSAFNFAMIYEEIVAFFSGDIHRNYLFSKDKARTMLEHLFDLQVAAYTDRPRKYHSQVSQEFEDIKLLLDPDDLKESLKNIPLPGSITMFASSVF